MFDSLIPRGCFNLAISHQKERDKLLKPPSLKVFHNTYLVPTFSIYIYKEPWSSLTTNNNIIKRK